MSEKSAYKKLRSLEIKGCLKIVSSERSGFRIRLNLPVEIPGIVPAPVTANSPLTIEQMDYFSVPENRLLILEREEHRCFYCLRALTSENHVIEPVISRPAGGNDYRNVVAACRACNNRKNSSNIEEFLRGLYRDSFLSGDELQARLQKLRSLSNGELKPRLRAFV